MLLKIDSLSSEYELVEKRYILFKTKAYKSNVLLAAAEVFHLQREAGITCFIGIDKFCFNEEER